MSLSKIFRPKTLVVSLLILVLAVLAFGYAAANIVPASGAGDGTGAVGGYTISGITYGLNVANPSTIDTITFIVTPEVTDPVTPAATQVRISVDDGGTWAAIGACDGTSTPTWVCTVTGMTVLSVENLKIVATS